MAHSWSRWFKINKINRLFFFSIDKQQPIIWSETKPSYHKTNRTIRLYYVDPLIDFYSMRRWFDTVNSKHWILWKYCLKRDSDCFSILIQPKCEPAVNSFYYSTNIWRSFNSFDKGIFFRISHLAILEMISEWQFLQADGDVIDNFDCIFNLATHFCQVKKIENMGSMSFANVEDVIRYSGARCIYNDF